MAATETIREFLVKLGYKQDEAALKKFSDGIGQATKAVVGLAAAVEASAALVAVGIERFASNLAALYYEAQRTNTSARELKALDLAAQNLGANAGEAEAAVEGLARALRENPAKEGVLQARLATLGLTVKRMADGSVDATDATVKLVAALKAMGPQAFYVARQFAEQLGIQGDTLNKLVRGNLMEEYVRKLKEIGPEFDQASKDSAEFMKDLRDLRLQFLLLGVEVERSLKEKLGFNLRDVVDYVRAHRKELAEQISAIVIAIKDAAVAIAGALQGVFNKLREWDAETGGLSTKLIALAAILKFTGAGSIIGGVLGLAAGLLRVAGAAGAASSAIGVLLGIGAGFAGWKIGEWLKPKIDKVVQDITGDKDATLGTALHNMFHRTQQTASFLQNTLGLSAAQAAGVTSRLQRESGLSASAENTASGAYGLAQWLGPRVREFENVMHKSLHGSSYDDQLRFLMYEMRNHPEYGLAALRGAKSSSEAYDIFTHLFERPGAADEAATASAGHARAIAIESTIHVNGVTDPEVVAAKVQEAQKRDLASVVRNVVPSVQ